jgi:hypothetical protein
MLAKIETVWWNDSENGKIENSESLTLHIKSE